MGTSERLASMRRDGLLIFNSVHKVMRAEKVLRKSGFDVKVMPVPRQLSSDCGLSLAFFLAELTQIIEQLEAEGVVPAETYMDDWGKFLKVEKPEDLANWPFPLQTPPGK